MYSTDMNVSACFNICETQRVRYVDPPTGADPHQLASMHVHRSILKVHRFISKCIGQFPHSYPEFLGKQWWRSYSGRSDFYAMVSVSVEQEVNDCKCV